jgi:hypothetical protein
VFVNILSLGDEVCSKQHSVLSSLAFLFWILLVSSLSNLALVRIDPKVYFLPWGIRHGKTSG